MLVDSNPDLSCVPVSLAPLSWLGVLGIEKCSLHIKEEDLHFPKPLRTCSRVPSLTELTARSLHGFLKSEAIQKSLHMYTCPCSKYSSLHRVSAEQCDAVVASAALLSPSASPGAGEMVGANWNMH